MRYRTMEPMFERGLLDESLSALMMDVQKKLEVEEKPSFIMDCDGDTVNEP